MLNAFPSTKNTTQLYIHWTKQVPISILAKLKDTPSSILLSKQTTKPQISHIFLDSFLAKQGVEF